MNYKRKCDETSFDSFPLLKLQIVRDLSIKPQLSGWDAPPTFKLSATALHQS